MPESISNSINVYMKEYLKYCTVGQLKDQINDTLSSAKQKLSQISASRRRNDPTLVNKKFYSYVNEIKNKQEEYDSIMNQTSEIEILLNRRKNKINESLQKYEKNKRSKTLTSFYRNQRNSQGHDNIGKMKENLLATASVLMTSTQSKIYTDIKNQTLKERYETQPNSVVQINAKSMLIDKIQQRVDPSKQLRGSLNNNQRKRLKSITNVLNISIDNREKKSNQKLYSFAKNNIKSQVKNHIKQYSENEMKNVQKQLKLQTEGNEKQKSTSVIEKSLSKKVKRGKNDVGHEHKAIKMIKERIKDNQNNSEAQWNTQKRLENIKSLLLKHHYENFLRKDLKMKLISSLDVYFRMKQVNPM